MRLLFSIYHLSVFWLFFVICEGCNDLESVYDNEKTPVTFSIIGDSISTLQGYNPEGYPVFYSERSPSFYINSPWWQQFSESSSWHLLTNSSYSGSTVSKYSVVESSWFFSTARLADLSKNGLPDYIFIFGGTNDWARSVVFEGREPFDSTSFVGAYRYLVQKLQKTYPSTKIICLSILPRDTGIIEANKARWTINDANTMISSICSDYSCRFVDLTNCGLLNNTNRFTYDGLHPNASGMTLISQCIVKQLNDLF